eukprot:193261-Pyramimonas_sp.AAC.1
MGGEPHVITTTWSLGGAPYGATNVKSMPKREIGGEPHGCTKIGGEPQVITDTGAWGGAPYGAPKRVKGAPNWAGDPM